MSEPARRRRRGLILAPAALALTYAGAAGAARVEFTQTRFVVEEGSDEAQVVLALRECGGRAPTGTARVRVEGGDEGSAIEGEDFFAHILVELGAVRSPDGGGERIARLAQVKLLVPADGLPEGEEDFALRLEALESTLDCGAGPEAVNVGPEAQVVVIEPPAPPDPPPPATDQAPPP